MGGTGLRASGRGMTVTLAMVMLLPLLPAHAADGVRATRAVEVSPATARRHLAWTQAPRSAPTRFDAFFKRAGGTTRRLNARGTAGFTTGGAIDEDGSTVAYWQRRDAKGDIKFYDVSSGRRRSASGRVNTRRYHEWGAAISGPWLLFARGRYGGSMRIFLLNRSTGNRRLLARSGGSGYLQPSDVTGRFATWTRCWDDFSRCRNYRYNSRTANATPLRNPHGRHQFAASVLGNGTVYFAESGYIHGCGSPLRVYRQKLSGDRRRLTTLADGTSIGATSVRRVSSSRVAVTYDRQRCDRPVADIYRIRVRG